MLHDQQFEHDTVLIPKETSWFGYYPDGAFNPIIFPNEVILITCNFRLSFVFSIQAEIIQLVTVLLLFLLESNSTYISRYLNADPALHGGLDWFEKFGRSWEGSVP